MPRTGESGPGPAVVAAGLAALVAVVFAVFWPAVGGAFLSWDDHDLLLSNPHFRGFDGAALAWMFTSMHAGHYMPLTWLSFALDEALFGMNPVAFHLVNIALHAINAGLAALLLAALLSRLDPGAEARRRWLVALGCALLFAVHPLRVESVAWITERRDVLCGVFYLGTLLAWLRYVDAPARSRAAVGWYLAALASFVASLLAKGWGISLPLLLLLLDVTVLRRLPHWRPEGRALLQLVVEKLPLLVPALLIGVALPASQASAGAALGLADYGLVERLLQAGAGVFWYLQKTLLPLGLSPLYPLALVEFSSWPYWAWSVGGLLVGLAALLLWRRHPGPSAALIAYGLILAPVLGLFQSGPQFVADRYAYFAHLPLTLLLAAWLVRRDVRVAAVSLPVAILIAAPLTWSQAHAWRSDLALWSQALKADPDNHVAREYRGNARVQAGDLDAAQSDLDRAVQARPDTASVYASRGWLHLARGDADAAIADFDRLLELRPRYLPGLRNRALAHARRGDWQAARLDLDRALRIAPDDIDALWNRALVHRQLGLREAQAADLRALLAIRPDHADARRLAAADGIELGG